MKTRLVLKQGILSISKNVKQVLVLNKNGSLYYKYIKVNKK